MKPILVAALLSLPVACSHLTSNDTKEIAYQRLSSCHDGPSLAGETLRSALKVSEHPWGIFLVEVRDETRNLLWAVIIQPSGESEVTQMAIDG
jgi:hypothetical protein